MIVWRLGEDDLYTMTAVDADAAGADAEDDASNKERDGGTGSTDESGGGVISAKVRGAGRGISTQMKYKRGGGG